MGKVGQIVRAAALVLFVGIGTQVTTWLLEPPAVFTVWAIAAVLAFWQFIDLLPSRRWVSRRSSLGMLVLVAILGAAVFDGLWWFTVMRPTSRNTQQVDEQHPMNTDDKPSIKIDGNSNIVQFGNNNQATIVQKETLELPAHKRDVVTQRMRPFGNRKIKIFLNHETPETAAFGAAVEAALKAAGIHVTEIGHMDVLGPVPAGVSFILTKSNAGDAEFAQALAEAFAAVGIVKGKVQAEYGNNDVFILYVTPL